MEIIACIPELPCQPMAGTAGPSACTGVEGPWIGEGRVREGQRRAGLAAGGQVAETGTPRPGSRGPSPAALTAAPEDLEPIERGAARPGAAGRRRTPMFPTPSVFVLAVTAAVVWAAAWRSERLRAIEQRRPQRGALEPAPTAAAARSVTP